MTFKSKNKVKIRPKALCFVVVTAVSVGRVQYFTSIKRLWDKLENVSSLRTRTPNEAGPPVFRASAPNRVRSHTCTQQIGGPIKMCFCVRTRTWPHGPAQPWPSVNTRPADQARWRCSPRDVPMAAVSRNLWMIVICFPPVLVSGSLQSSDPLRGLHEVYGVAFVNVSQNCALLFIRFSPISGLFFLV